MDTERFPILIKNIYDAVSELEVMFTKLGEKRHFTPDGHLVGSIGEVLAAYHYGIVLSKASLKTYDGIFDGREVQIKAVQEVTKRKCVRIKKMPDYLLVLEISKQGIAKEIYNGPGEIIWDFIQQKKRKPSANDYYQVSFPELKKLMEKVAENDKFKRINP